VITNLFVIRLHAYTICAGDLHFVRQKTRKNSILLERQRMRALKRFTEIMKAAKYTQMQ
jgi:hypothetical protein